MSKNIPLKKSSLVVWIVVGLMAAAVGLLVLRSSKKTTTPKTNREVALTCTTDMATKFHIHPHLEIFINGEKQAIPSEIGITSGCMNAIHTHDATGKLHVESPEKRDFTLADFFAVWNKTFTKDQIFDYKTDETHKIRQTVNGIETQDYENILLNDGDEIIIYYQ